jgi:hypothetical protein
VRCIRTSTPWCKEFDKCWLARLQHHLVEVIWDEVKDGRSSCRGADGQRGEESGYSHAGLCMLCVCVCVSVCVRMIWVCVSMRIKSGGQSSGGGKKVYARLRSACAITNQEMRKEEDSLRPLHLPFPHLKLLTSPIGVFRRTRILLSSSESE